MSQKILSRIYQQLKLTESLLSEGMHWPEDYRKKAFDRINAGISDLTARDINEILDSLVAQFEQLSHKNSNHGYFLGIIRMFIDYGKTRDKRTEFVSKKMGNIVKTLLLITNELKPEIKEDIKQRWSIEEFEKNTAPIIQAIAKQDADKLSTISGTSTDYEVIPINSYEELNEKFGGDKTGYKGQSEWCHTNGRSTYDSWTKNGTQMFFVLAKKGWENIDPPEPKTTNAYDAYGLSLIAILVDVYTEKLLNATLRWNHVISPSNTDPKTTVDNAFLGWGDMSERLDFNVKNEIDKVLKDVQQAMASKKANAEKRIQDKLATVTEITNETFSKEERSSMTNVTIPDTVTSIGDHAFSDCYNLTNITIPDTVTIIGDNAFTRTGLTSVTIPDSVTSIGDDAFYNCRVLTNVTIGDGVTSIGFNTFSNCVSLTSVTIPDSVTEIGGWTFRECTGLTSIKIPNHVTSIGRGVFSYCRGLSSLTIPDSVTSIEHNAFYSCSSLTSVTIPDSVTSIGGRAFQYCDSLTDVTIGKGVKSIGKYAFDRCEGLTNVTFEDKTMDEVRSMEESPWGIKNPAKVIRVTDASN